MIGFGDLQCLEDRQGLVPGLAGPPGLAKGEQGIAEISQRLGLAVALAEVAEQPEAVALAGDRVLVASQLLIYAAQVAQATGLVTQVTQLAGQVEALLVACDRLLVVPQPPVGDAEAAEAAGLPAAVAEFASQSQALLVVVQRLLVVA